MDRTRECCTPGSTQACLGQQPMILYQRSMLLQCFLVALALAATGPALGAPPVAGDNVMYGVARMRGRGFPKGRVVRVEASPTFFLFGDRGKYSGVADQSGRFKIEHLPDGFYWVVAYIDDDKDGRRTPGEISGYPRLAPIFVGPQHRRERVTIEMDPVHAILATRFIPAAKPNEEPRLELAFAAVYVRHPATGAPLPDAVVEMEEDEQRMPLPFDAAFPGGAHAVRGEGRPAGERYVFVVSHPALGRAPRRIALHSRSVGAVPRFASAPPASPPPLCDLPITWNEPAWVNFATVEVHEHTAAGLRRLWPEDPAAAVSLERRAVIPGGLLLPGRRLRIALVFGRADVRAEQGEIWATSVAERDITVAATPPPQDAKPAPPKGKGVP